VDATDVAAEWQIFNTVTKGSFTVKIRPFKGKVESKENRVGLSFRGAVISLFMEDRLHESNLQQEEEDQEESGQFDRE
jgi:hypothetical protein